MYIVEKFIKYVHRINFIMLDQPLRFRYKTGDFKALFFYLTSLFSQTFEKIEISDIMKIYKKLKKTKWCQIIPSIYVSLFDGKSPFNDPSNTLQRTPLASIVKFKSLGLHHLWANLKINCMSPNRVIESLALIRVVGSILLHGMILSVLNQVCKFF